MSTTISESQLASLLKRIRTLASSTKKGKLYRRWQDVETEIKRVALLPQEQLSAEIGNLHSETLVFMTRLIRQSDERFYGALMTEIGRRIL